MLNIYIHKRIEGLQHIPLMNYFWGSNSFDVQRFGDKALSLFNKQFFNLVEDHKDADYFLIPHNYFYIKDQTYLNEFISLSQKYSKKIIIFSYGDSDDDIPISNSIIFRTSQYRYKLKKNEIIMPAIADDLLGDVEISIRTKSEKPIIGFCGWASFESPKRAIIENIKLFVINIKAIFLGKNNLFHKRGILFRMEALRELTKSTSVVTNFIIRDSFSGNEKTRKIDKDVARQEYIKNIVDSDLSLAVKGDGNFSIRFYEILSLGRIPLFVDTNCVLPLEEEINYKDFIVRVSSSDMKKLDEVAVNFYNSIRDEEFKSKQKYAREVFEKYLRVDKYFDFVFNPDFLKKYENSN